MKKILATLLAISLMVGLMVVPAMAVNHKIGFERLTQVMELNSGIKATMTEPVQVSEGVWQTTVSGDKQWVNGVWTLTHVQTVPDMKLFKNAYWYGFYTDIQLHRNGYILAVKQK